MSQRLTGKVALVTGAARGQGRAHAQRLSAEGADVILIDIAGPLPASVPYDSPTPTTLPKQPGWSPKTDVAPSRRRLTPVTSKRCAPPSTTASPNSVASTSSSRTPESAAPPPWDQITGNDFQDTIDTNVVGTWNTVMAGAHHIIDGGRGGSIILIGSAAGVKMQAFMVHYTASKHAITGLARAFAAELGRHHIRVNALHPGAVATAMGTGRMREALQNAADTYPHLQGMHKPLLPEGIAQPEDIADAVAWLASDESKFVTASTVSVDLGVAYC